MKKLVLLFFYIPSILNAGSMNAIGTKGKASDVNKVIVVNMYDNYYEP